MINWSQISEVGKQLFSSFDFVVPSSIEPVAIIEAKIERIRSDYFKALLFDVDLIKRKYARTKFYIVYSREKLEETQLARMQELSSQRVDGLFDLSEMTILMERIRRDLETNLR
jgi:hypothetical protein